MHGSPIEEVDFSHRLLVETMQGVTAHASGGNITAPGGVHTYPKILTLQWKNGTNSATLTLTNPSIITAQSPVINTNATMYGYPQYMRLEGTGTLNVQWNGRQRNSKRPCHLGGRLCTLSSIFLLHTHAFFSFGHYFNTREVLNFGL